ncbi:DUF167 domain-containing protein [Roseomonas sp. NAR14]|uniref:UPF0235 protein M0638_27040 n=1 Tax=Roseomonas acroporae TaxID=2937791 RepID=A0A9X1YDX7_9PROT|nr:DUF167 domain-containing protein [Roseomonas acroporae]MCK8788017.1 DUF167 domain-containing protein [Roseomonas acroporae]
MASRPPAAEAPPGPAAGPAAAHCWQPAAGGLAVRVKVQPRARRAGCGGLAPAADGPRLRVAVTEPPEDGRATRAACATLAGALGLPARAVALLQGASSREKLLAVAGDPAALAAELERLERTA